MSVSGWAFAAFVLFSLFLVAGFYIGVRRNISKARSIASLLEESLKPEDQTYTWLGGVIGFYAEYKVKGFDRVTATLRLSPRHAVLWYPFSWLLGRRDNLQMLFFLNRKIKGEFHIVRSSLFEPRIKGEGLAKDTVVFKGASWKLLFNDRRMEKKLFSLLEPVLPLLKHAALTPDKNVLYLSFNVENIGAFADSFPEFFSRLKGWGA